VLSDAEGAIEDLCITEEKSPRDVEKMMESILNAD
jgi:hypothetical protein